MRSLMPLVTALYPRSWRERYAAEFDALLEDMNPGIGTAWNVLIGALGMRMRNVSYSKIFAAAAAFGALAAAGLFIAQPKQYLSEAVLRVGSEPRMTQEALDHLNTLVQNVESRPILTYILTTENLYPRERSRRPAEDMIDLMRRAVKVDPLTNGSFRVAFVYNDAVVARKVVNALAEGFIDANAAVATNGDPALNLAVLDPANLPDRPVRSHGALIAFGFCCAVPMLGLLLVLRWISVRRQKAA